MTAASLTFGLTAAVAVGAVPVEPVRRAGLVQITLARDVVSVENRFVARGRLLTLELLQLILCLRVLRVELHGGLEILDRGPLVPLRVLRRAIA